MGCLQTTNEYSRTCTSFLEMSGSPSNGLRVVMFQNHWQSTSWEFATELQRFISLVVTERAEHQVYSNSPGGGRGKSNRNSVPSSVFSDTVLHEMDTQWSIRRQSDQIIPTPTPLQLTNSPRWRTEFSSRLPVEALFETRVCCHQSSSQTWQLWHSSTIKEHEHWPVDRDNFIDKRKPSLSEVGCIKLEFKNGISEREWFWMGKSLGLGRGFDQTLTWLVWEVDKMNEMNLTSWWTPTILLHFSIHLRLLI